MYLDCKITTWERIELPPDISDALKAKIIIALENGVITNGSDLYAFVEDNGGDTYDLECNTLDCQEPLSLRENGGQPTLELFSGNKKIWDNEDELAVPFVFPLEIYEDELQPHGTDHRPSSPYNVEDELEAHSFFPLPDYIG